MTEAEDRTTGTTKPVRLNEKAHAALKALADGLKRDTGEHWTMSRTLLASLKLANEYRETIRLEREGEIAILRSEQIRKLISLASHRAAEDAVNATAEAVVRAHYDFARQGGMDVPKPLPYPEGGRVATVVLEQPDDEDAKRITLAWIPVEGIVGETRPYGALMTSFRPLEMQYRPPDVQALSRANAAALLASIKEIAGFDDDDKEAEVEQHDEDATAGA